MQLRQNQLSILVNALSNGLFGAFSFIKALSLLRIVVAVPQLPGIAMLLIGGLGLTLATLIVYQDPVITHHYTDDFPYEGNLCDPSRRDWLNPFAVIFNAMSLGFIAAVLVVITLYLLGIMLPEIIGITLILGMTSTYMYFQQCHRYLLETPIFSLRIPDEHFLFRCLGHAAALLKGITYAYAVYSVLLNDFPIIALIPFPSLALPLLWTLTASSFAISYLHQRTKLVEAAKTIRKKIPQLLNPWQWSFEWLPTSRWDRLFFLLKLATLALYFIGQVAPVIWILTTIFHSTRYLVGLFFASLGSLVGLTTTCYFGYIFLFPELQNIQDRKPPLSIETVKKSIYQQTNEQSHSRLDKIMRYTLALGGALLGSASAFIKGLLPLISTTYLVTWYLGATIIPMIAIKWGAFVALASIWVQHIVVIPGTLIGAYATIQGKTPAQLEAQIRSQLNNNEENSHEMPNNALEVNEHYREAYTLAQLFQNDHHSPPVSHFQNSRNFSK